MSKSLLAKIYFDTFIEETMVNLKYLPTTLGINLRLAKNDLAEKIDQKKEEIQSKKADKQRNKAEQKKANDLANQERTEDVSEAIWKHVKRIANGSKLLQVEYLDRARKTQDLINFVYYYMQDSNAQLRTDVNQTERELINAISEFFEFGKIYEDDSVVLLRNYDPDYPEYDSIYKFLLSISELEKKKVNNKFMEKIQLRKEQLAAEYCDDEPELYEESSIWQKNEEGIIKPIFISNAPESILQEDLPIKGEGISDELFEKLEKVFTPLVDQHRYEITPSGMITLFVRRNALGVEDYYVVDPGMVMGKNKISVLAKVDNDTLFVSEDHPEILRRVLSTAFYILMPNEIQEIICDYFRNITLYRYIDMSNTEFLNNLTPEEFQLLGKKLTFIIGKVREQSQGIDLPRFRFNYWSSVNDFMIISDPTVKSPLVDISETSPIICEGLIFEVKGDYVVQTYRDSRIEYHIDRYGDM